MILWLFEIRRAPVNGIVTKSQTVIQSVKNQPHADFEVQLENIITITRH